MVSAYLQSCVSEHKRTPFKLEVVHSSDAAPGTVKFPQRCGLVQHTLTETIQPPHLAAYFMHSLPATLPSPGVMIGAQSPSQDGVQAALKDSSCKPPQSTSQVSQCIEAWRTESSPAKVDSRWP